MNARGARTFPRQARSILSDRSFHLELYQSIELNGVLERQLFGELLERSYINKIESYTGEQSVLYTKETIEQSGYATVRTEIVNKRDLNVAVDYKLLQRDGNWQVYDVVIEGVSLVNNYRTQFHNIVSQESYDSLVKKLKLKLEQERAASPTKG